MFTISDLVKGTGVPAATIHHYRHLGLLPPARPIARNRFLYGQDHLRALTTIRELRTRQHLPLRAIAALLPSLLSGTGGETVLLSDLPDTRTRLVAAARTAFTAHGFSEVTIADLCAAAGVAKGTFYRHFASKEDVFFTAAEAVVSEISDELATIQGSEPMDPSVLDLIGTSLPLLLELARRALQDREACGERALASFLRLEDAALQRLGTDHANALAVVLEASFFQRVVVGAAAQAAAAGQGAAVLPSPTPARQP
ncbi:MAG: TetR family transcriptional regulator [Acidimicrobiales bacterium]